MALFYKDLDRWHVESVRVHGPNVISLILITGTTRYGVFGTYIPPNDATTLMFMMVAFD